MELTFENITKNYKGKQILKGISLTMGVGVYGLLGPNGAGKTTMIRILANVIHPTEGCVLYDGKDIHAIGEEYRAKIGYLPHGSFHACIWRERQLSGDGGRRFNCCCRFSHLWNLPWTEKQNGGIMIIYFCRHVPLNFHVFDSCGAARARSPGCPYPSMTDPVHYHPRFGRFPFPRSARVSVPIREYVTRSSPCTH